jgi:hypothetical protein
MRPKTLGRAEEQNSLAGQLPVEIPNAISYHYKLIYKIVYEPKIKKK